MVAEENFLRRWSRRKHERVEQQPRGEPAAQDARPADAPARPAADAEPRAAAGAAPAPQPELPSVDSLKGLASDYKEFLDPAVDENLRRSALKSLFRDPHFNVMDGLDVYIDDYSRPDPIPESMLKTLAHAKRVLFPEEQQQEPQAEKRPAPALSSSESAPVPASVPAQGTATPGDDEEKKS